ncbi:MAG: GNAT family N-acetyltransferase [Sulfolobales archaeon]
MQQDSCEGYLLIRRASIDDAEEIYRLYNSLSEEDLYMRFLYIKHPSVEEIKSYLSDPNCIVYVAETCNEIVAEGFLHRSGEIAIVVHPRFRRRGIAKKIFIRLYEEARKIGIERIFFYTSPLNIPVIKIARRFGCRLRLIEDLYMGIVDICPETDIIVKEMR